MGSTLRLMLACSVALGATVAQGQAELQWAVRYDEFTNLIGNASQVLVEPTGRTTIVGRYADNLLVARFSPEGNLLVSHEIPGRSCGMWEREGRCAALDAVGNVFVADASGYVMKFTPEGVLEWDLPVAQDAGVSPALSIAAVDAAGNVYLVGTTSGAAGLDGLALKYSAAGTMQWASPWSSEGDDLPSVALLDADGDLVVASSASGALDLLEFDGTTGATIRRLQKPELGPPVALQIGPSGDTYLAGSSIQTYEMYVVRLDEGGAQLWAAFQPGASPSALRVDSGGNVYIGGYANYDSTFFRYMLRKLAPTGALEWERLYYQYGDSQILAMVLHGDAPIVTGEFGYYNDVIRTMEHSPSGRATWDASYRGTYTGYGSVNYGTSLGMDAAGNVYVSGYTLNQSDLGYPYKPTLIKYALATDGDGDGSYVGYGECNDADPLISLDAGEVPYNGIDENCNGMWDDDDLDRDGHLSANDCNDGVASIHPGALEYNYDGIDQDCDGVDGTIDGTLVTIPQESVNIGMAQCNEASAGGTVSAFPVWEGEQGVDLNGDNDTSDNVLGYYDFERDHFVNIGVETSMAVTDGVIIVFGQWYSGTLSYYRIADGTIHDSGVVGALERIRSVSGGRFTYTDRSADLDGDGLYDPRPCVYDTNLGAGTCAASIGSRPTLSGHQVAFEAQFGTIALYDFSTGIVDDTGVLGSSPIIDGDYIAFAGSPGIAYYRISTGAVRQTTYPISRMFSISDGRISFLADEGAYWGDLTGDGDRDDYEIVVYYDILNDTVVNTGVVGCCGPDISRGVIVYDIYEDKDGVDLNGDGDTSDCVQQYLRINTLVVTGAQFADSKLTVTARSPFGAGANLVPRGLRSNDVVGVEGRLGGKGVGPGHGAH